MDDSLQIEVTNKHIQKGRRRSCNQCPIALAIYDKIRERPYIDAVVGTDAFILENGLIGDNAIHHKAPLPLKAQSFISAFDNEQDVHPTSFSLSIPREFWRESDCT